MANKLASTTDNTAAAKPAKLPMPALGASCVVRVAKGVVLMNNDTGVNFTPETDTPVTVTVTTRRRIEDGDLQLVG
jgi:hypothetical protein